MNDDTLPLYGSKSERYFKTQNADLSDFDPYDQEISNMKMDYINGAPQNAGPVVTAPAPAPLNSPLPLLLGPENAVTTCPHCQCAVRTTIKHSVTTRTHRLAGLCFFFCCCCCLPYCMDSARNTDHYCPNCFKYLGTYEK